MTATIATPEPVADRDPTVWVALDGDEISKLETYRRYDATWRGARVIVTMASDRYRAGYDRNNMHMTEWRTVAREAKEWDGTDSYRAGADVTATARARLADACEPLVTAWLASPEYVEAERRGLVAAIRRELADSARYGVERTRRLVAKYGERIGPDSTAALVAAIDAAEAYTAALDAIG